MLLLDLDPPPACLPTISSHLAGCRFYRAHSRPRRFSMLPASDLTEILANLSALNLQPSTAAAVLGALAPLLRTAETPPAVLEPQPSRPDRASERGAGGASANTGVARPAKRAIGRSQRSRPIPTPRRPTSRSSPRLAAAPSRRHAPRSRKRSGRQPAAKPRP